VSSLALLRRSRNARIIGLAVALSLVTGGVALSASSGLSFVPNKADQITNIDVLRTQIKGYYGDPTGSGVFATNSNYAREAESVAAAGQRWLKAKLGKASGTPAIVLDVDDTTLTTWNYEIFSNWAYNPTTNATYVNGQLFPATPGMVHMVNWAADHGYAIFFLTGRPATQAAATLGNLLGDDGIPAPDVDAGYPDPVALFTKPAVADYPQYLLDACADEIAAGHSCTTIHYKSATRAYIESLGYDIVANFGDQYSDLKGGFADKSFKMPNPNYYLP
jgi:predicted secreted acid phosphatase